MKSSQLKRFISVLCSVFLMVSCGSGGGGGLVAGGGIGGTGIISSGTITAFGSVEVNGTKFDTSNAAIIINGVEIGVGDDFIPDNLELGMVVTVEGRIKEDKSFVADRVIYSANVVGPVENISDIDATTKELVVLGQTVIVNVITQFEETDFNGIAEDDVVSVSGYFDDNGVIRATFLEKIGDITSILEFEVTGFVENLDPDLKTFMINSLRIDYSSISSNLPEGIPAEDQFVEVEGRLAAGGEMIAMRIELAAELGGEDGDEFEIMGFITDIVSDFEFTVGNQVVQTEEDTIFVDGIREDIALGVKLEAEGSLVDGILIAEEIEFWEPNQIEVEGLVSNVASDNEFTVGDQVVQTDAETVFEGVDPGKIEVGMKIEVKGVPADIDHSVLLADKVSLEMD